jgi:diguanylate cyclase (GGDEF)-like protein
MIRIRGLLSKTLLLVTIVAIVSLAASYGFINAQQSKRFEAQIEEVQYGHLRISHLLFDQQLDELRLHAEELINLSTLSRKTPEEGKLYFQEIWSRLQTSYSLSSLSLSDGETRYQFGSFPSKYIESMQKETIRTGNAQSAIICHLECELSTSVPITFNRSTWTLTLIADLAQSVEFLNLVTGSNVGILAPSEAPVTSETSFKRYITEIITGAGELEPLLNTELSESQFEELENSGLRLNVNNNEYFVWFEQIDSIAYPFNVMFIREISDLINQQTAQKQQVILIFVTVTLGILLTLITFSIIPISQINKLRRAISLIASKEYNTARYRLGQRKERRFNDELYDLEDEFRNAIDMLESYEHELDVSQKRLVRQATIDSTTGLYTRNVLVDDLQIIGKKNTAHNVAIFFLDLDGFKPVNDNLGHEAGDIMLKKIGYRLKGVSNKFIKVYRIGGDEFVICYTNFDAKDALLEMAESVVQLFAAPFHIYETNITISASIGIATQDASSIDADQLLRYGDIAMYQAKEEGKNRYKFFDESMEEKAQLRFTIKNDFANSLAENQLFLVYQPIVDSSSRKVTKLEALCRWQHPELGFIPPPTFIDVLEESENMNRLFEWIVQSVIREVAFLDEIRRDDIIISVNLSSSQLVNDRAIEFLKEELERCRINPNRIELEITETTLITNFQQAKFWIEYATDLGFRVAIDDFGAGYSSLSYLTAFNYNTVKLDRSLLDKIDVDERQQRIVGSLTQMIHSLSVPIVAEGAETEAQFEELRKLGCDYIQGYLISKPIKHDDLVIFLQDESDRA